MNMAMTEMVPILSTLLTEFPQNFFLSLIWPEKLTKMYVFRFSGALYSVSLKF